MSQQMHKVLSAQGYGEHISDVSECVVLLLHMDTDNRDEHCSTCMFLHIVKAAGIHELSYQKEMSADGCV
jgi:hypothetical protein